MYKNTNSFLGTTLHIGIIILFIYLCIIPDRNKKRRNKQLLLFATTNNYQYNYNDPFNISGIYSYYEVLNKGYSAATNNVISGTIEGKNFKIFDHEYNEWNGRSAQTYYFSAIIVDLPRHFKDLIIRFENFGDKIASAVGLDDIDFESEEFSKSFYVRSSDKKFAYDIVHPKVMEYLLQHPGWNIELRFSSIMIQCSYGKFNPLEIESHLNFIYGFINLIPDYIWQSCSKTK